ncbi:MAG: tRNA (adenosine(37)-N6)-threonylcarbamoyltransferase complex dimerization subunit type 1 TsaB [Bacilli bacterium]|nr:tRNA (adenosine(37)-N6)-threonylcarbamoyltransferase complex dimerization subunit type 1 TsaB [Bacilli bacterium]
MRILYIDTTTNYLYGALWNKDQVIESVNIKLDKDLSVFTLQKISEMLSKQNIEPKEVDKIIVVNGPGSFTGIRVGVTIAKTYALGLQKKISTISSLQAMAASSKTEATYKVPVIDARRGFVYAAIYDNQNTPVLKEQYLSLTALNCAIDNLPGEYTIITNDSVDIEKKEQYIPNFFNIINLYKDKEEENPHLVNPMYLKLTEAEEKKQSEIS